MYKEEYMDEIRQRENSPEGRATARNIGLNAIASAGINFVGGVVTGYCFQRSLPSNAALSERVTGS